MALPITSRRSTAMAENRMSRTGCTEDEAVAHVVLERVRDRIRQVAHARVALALKLGMLVRPAVCSVCARPHRRPKRPPWRLRFKRAEQGIHAHHPDYSEPLRVVWLCRACHHAEHVRLRREAKENA